MAGKPIPIGKPYGNGYDEGMSKVLAARLLVFVAVVFGIAVSSFSQATSLPVKKETVGELMSQLRDRIQSREFRWDLSLFHDRDWKERGHSVNGLPLIYWTCGNTKALNRSLILSAVHGDEVTPVFFGFRLVEWLKANPQLCKDNLVVVAPIVNPDGFLRYRAGTRTNYNKVDLNRNFETPDWAAEAHKRWKQTAKGGQAPQRRYYPGDKAGSEPEIKFQEWLIEEFQPTKILSVHAPLDFLEVDGPDMNQMKVFAQSYIESIESMKKEMTRATKLLRFQVYGTFPGSLGNYAGKQKGIPTITTELPTANPHMAAEYFGNLEESTRVFIDYDFSKHASQNQITKTD